MQQKAGLFKSMTQSNTKTKNGKHCDNKHNGGIHDDNDKKNPAPRHKKKNAPRPPKKITETYLHNAGLYYLQRFATSSENFKRVMGRKIEKSCFFHKEQDKDSCLKMLENVTERFLESGLLDDQGYTRAMVTSMRRRGLSFRAIEAKLKHKGLPSALIKQTVIAHDRQYNSENEDEYSDSQDAELRAALVCARKKRLQPFNPDKETEKSLASLARAGFTYDIAKKVISMEIKDADSIIANYY